MTQTNLQEERMGLIQFIWKSKKPILIITAIAAIASIVVSFLITPLYLSSAIVFPAASSNVSFDAQRNVKAAAMDFGEEEQAEQLVQILQSSRIKDRIVKKYDLLADYEISENDPNKYYKLNKAYYGNFSFNRTRFEKHNNQ